MHLECTALIQNDIVRVLTVHLLLSFDANKTLALLSMCHCQRASQFDPDVVLNQLRYSGMLETVKIRKAGFPVRRTFKDFYGRSEKYVRTTTVQLIFSSLEACVLSGYIGLQMQNLLFF